MSGADLVASLEKEIDTLIAKYDTLYAQYQELNAKYQTLNIEYQELKESTSQITVYTYPPTALMSVYTIQNGGFILKHVPHIRFSGTQISYVVSESNINYANDVALIVFDVSSAVLSIPVVSSCGTTNVHVVKTEELSGDQSVIPVTNVKSTYSKCAVFAGYSALNSTFNSTYLHFEFTSPSQAQYLGKTDNINDDEYLVPIQLIVDAYV